MNRSAPVHAILMMTVLFAALSCAAVQLLGDQVVTCTNSSFFSDSIVADGNVVVTIAASNCTITLQGVTLMNGSITFTTSAGLSNVSVVLNSVRLDNTSQHVSMQALLPQCLHCQLELNDVDWTSSSTPGSSSQLFAADQVLAQSGFAVVKMVNLPAPVPGAFRQLCVYSNACTVEIDNVTIAPNAFNETLASSTASSLYLHDITRPKNGLNFIGASSKQISIDVERIVFGVDSSFNLGAMAIYSTDSFVAARDVSCVAEWSVGAFDLGCFSRIGFASARFVANITDVHDGTDLFNGGCGSATNCTMYVSHVRNVFRSISSFSFRPSLTDPLPMNNSASISDVRDASYSFAAPCTYTVVCRYTFTNGQRLSNFTLAFVGAFSNTPSIFISDVHQVSNNVFASPLMATNNGVVAFSELSDLDNSAFQSSDEFLRLVGTQSICARYSVVVCELFQPLIAKLPVVNATVVIANVSNVTGTMSFGNFLTNAVGTNITIVNVSQVDDSLIFQGLLQYAGVADLCSTTMLSAFQVTAQVIYGSPCLFVGDVRLTLQRVSHVTPARPLTLSRLANSSHRARIQVIDTCLSNLPFFTDGASNGTLAVSYTAGAVLCNGPVTVTVDAGASSTSEVAFGPFENGVWPTTVSVVNVAVLLLVAPIVPAVAVDASMSRFVTSMSLGGQGRLNISSINLSQNQLSLSAAVAVLLAFPQAQLVNLSGNPLSGHLDLSAVTDTAAVVGRVLDLSTNAALTVGYSCGMAVPDLFFIRRGTATVVSVGSWLGWSPRLVGRFSGFPGPQYGPCPCRAGSTVTLSAQIWASCIRASQTYSLSHTPTPTSTASRSGSDHTRTVIPASSACTAEPYFFVQPAFINGKALADGGSRLTLFVSPPFAWASVLGGQISLVATTTDGDSDVNAIALNDAINDLMGAGWSVSAHQNVLNITFGAAKGLRMVSGANGTLVVSIGEAAFNCSGSAPQLLSLPVAPWTDPVVAAARDAAVATAAVGLAATVVGTAAAADIQSIVLLGNVKCGSSSGKSASSTANFILGPLIVLSDAKQGVILGNLILVALVGALQFGVGCIYVFAFLRRRRKQSQQPRDQSIDFSAAHPAAVAANVDVSHKEDHEASDAERAMILVRFPAYLINAATLAQQGTAFQAFSLLLSGGASALSLIGLVVVLTLPAVLVWGAKRWAQPSFDRDSECLLFFKYEYILQGVPSTSWWRRLAHAVVPYGRWGPKSKSGRFAAPFRNLRPVWVMFAVAPVLQTTLSSFVASLPVAVGDVSLCSLQFMILGLIPLAFAGISLIAQPYVTPLLHWKQLASSFTVFLAAVASVGMVRAQHDGESPTGYLQLSQAASILQLILLVARLAVSLSVSTMDSLFWKDDGRRVVWVEGMSPFTPERVDLDVAMVLVVNDDSDVVQSMLASDRDAAASLGYDNPVSRQRKKDAFVGVLQGAIQNVASNL